MKMYAEITLEGSQGEVNKFIQRNIMEKFNKSKHDTIEVPDLEITVGDAKFDMIINQLTNYPWPIEGFNSPFKITLSVIGYKKYE